MQTRIRAAVVLLSLAGITGVWLALAPFVAPIMDRYQPVGADWIAATTHHVATGVLLVTVGLVTVLTLVATALRAVEHALQAESDPLDARTDARTSDA